jgi:hypothetical protein
MLAKQRELYEV